ncbi:MAG: diacylglycerol kinase family protein [Byssovorax sp.]
MKPLLIVNPRSSGGRTGKVFEQMRGPIERALGEVEVALTDRSRHAVDIAREAALAGRETVVAVGGDGSIHEVVNGLMEARDKGATATRLGIIGQGTGGDFRKTLGIEHRLDKYCAVIAAGKTRPLDVPRFSYVDNDGKPASAFFVNILSAGMGGLVDRYVATAGRSLGPTVTYYVAALRGLLNSQIGVLRCTTTLDGKTEEKEIRTRNIALCNGQFFGSGMHVGPMAKIDDGILDVVDMGDTTRLHVFLTSNQIYSAKHLQDPAVSHFRCQKIKLELVNTQVADVFALDVDGEPLGGLPIEVEVVKGALPVLAP